MNQQILNIPMTASIHTITLRTKQKPHIPQSISKEIMNENYSAKTLQWFIRINPNKVNGDIFQYSQYCNTIDSLMKQIQVSNYSYYRIDLRIDCYQDVFKMLYQINLLLISLFATSYKRNEGQAVGHLCLLSKDFCDVSYDNQYLEMKFYDKKFQTMDADPAKARLEIRCLKTLRLDGMLPLEFKKVVFKTLDELPKKFEALQDKCNEYLFEAYQVHCRHCNGIGRKRDFATEFLSHQNNSLSIFTREQLRRFLLECNIAKNKVFDRAEYIVRKTRLQFFDEQDIVNYITKLKESINLFFET